MRIHKEGHGILIRLLLILAVANALVFLLMPAGHSFILIFLLLSIIIFLFILWFFRLPDRPVDRDKNIIVSPADGRVVAVEEVEETEYFNDRRIQVSVFMSPLNVHVNYFPVDGLVKYLQYHPGDYLVAWHPKASDKNERTTVVIENRDHTAVLVRQIAGAVARRVVCYAKTGEEFRQGQELGFIKFGSRVDLLISPDVNLKVKPGDKVFGKTSVIATFN